MSWTAPAVDGTHGAATGYNLRSSPSGAGTWTTVTGVANPYVITGLTGAAAIDVEVQSDQRRGKHGRMVRHYDGLELGSHRGAG